MLPLIGLNTSLLDMENALRAKAICHLKYVDAIAGAGGIPIVIPPYTERSMIEPVLSRLDGFCLIGGPDYDPSHYGGHAQPSSELMHARRHTFDVWLAEALLTQWQKPVMGICGGHQLINIAAGGALIQDLRTEWKPGATQVGTLSHADEERKGSPHEGASFQHEVAIMPGCQLAEIIGTTRIQTNSYHHQAVHPERLGRELIATAWSEDGVIEAIELKKSKRFLLGVQWHPERQTEEAVHRKIFEAFVRAATVSSRSA